VARFGEQPMPCGFLAIQVIVAKFGEQKVTIWQSSQDAEQACLFGSGNSDQSRIGKSVIT